MKPKFGPGAKVFAKVRGYPAWPARIEGCADETPNKVKYHVYFYGTGETAVVKNQDVVDYVENKNKLGKLKKQKNFTEAMQQIESELSPEQKTALAALEAAEDKTASPAVKDTGANKDKDKDSGSETPKTKVSQVNADSSDSGTPGPPYVRRPSTSTKTPKPVPASKPTPKDAKRKHEPESSPEDPTPKRPNLAATPGAGSPSSDKEKESKVVPAPESTSRSGRKLKPKKFSDNEEEEVQTKDPSSPPKEKEDKKPKDVKKPRPKSLKGSDDNNDTGAGDWYLLATRGDTKIKINLKLNRPDFEDGKKRNITVSEWENLVFDQARALKKRIEKGDESITESDATDYMERFTKVKAATVHIVRSPSEEANFRRETYDIEDSLLDIEVQIRNSLSLKGADTKSCLNQLDRLRNLRVTALMLKKHPQIVRTMRKLRRYIGNTIVWNMTEEETREFNCDAEKLRSKAEEIVNHFKTLFFQPTPGSFWDHFSNELHMFNQKTSKMSMEDVFAIITEPE